MDEEYFVTPRPRPDPVEPLAEPTVPLEDLDLAPLLRDPSPGDGWVKGLSVLGQVLLGLGALTLAALPVLALVAIGRFLDSLPW